MTEYLYRAEARRYSACSLDVNGGEYYYTTGPQIHFQKFEVLKRTPKGAWIKLGEVFPDEPDLEIKIEKRFVLLTARKKFACNTEEQALESLIARKAAYERHLNNRLEEAQADQREAKRQLLLLRGDEGPKLKGYGDLIGKAPPWNLQINGP